MPKKGFCILIIIVVLFSLLIVGAFYLVKDGTFTLDDYYLYGERLIFSAHSDSIKPDNIKNIKLFYNDQTYDLNYEIVEDEKNQKIINISTIKDEESGYFNLDDINKDSMIYIEIIYKGDRTRNYKINSKISDKLEYYQMKDNQKVTINLNNFKVKLSNYDEEVYDIILDPNSDTHYYNKIKDTTYDLKVANKMKELLESEGYKVLIVDKNIAKKDRISLVDLYKVKYYFVINMLNESNNEGFSIVKGESSSLNLANSIITSIKTETKSTTSTLVNNMIAEGIYLEDNYFITNMGGKLTNKDSESLIGAETYLINLGYLLNKNDYQKLLNNEDNYGTGIAKGIINYLNS